MTLNVFYTTLTFVDLEEKYGLSIIKLEAGGTLYIKNEKLYLDFPSPPYLFS